jgi:HlyD family secretion protein
MSDLRDNRLNSDGVAGGPATAAPPATLADRVRSLRLPSQSAAAPARTNWFPWVLVGVLLLTSLGLGYRAIAVGRGEAVKSAEPVKPTGEQDAVAGSGDVALESKGYIIPAHQIQVSPKVGGMVTELNFEEGMRVKEGYVLAQLETVDYQADRDHAVGALAEAQQSLEELTQYRGREIEQVKARWDEAQVQARMLEIDSRRSTRLRSGSAMADRDVEQAESAWLAMKNHANSLRLDYELLVKGPRDKRIAAYEERVRQAKADLAKAQWKLDSCTVRAPIAGTILTKKAEKGNIVNPIAFNVSANLCDMADLADLEVDLSIQERDVAQVFKSQKCRVVSEAFPNRKPYEGYVSRLMPTADRAKGAIPVRVKLHVPREEEGVFLKPDMSVIVSFLKETKETSRGAK